MNSPLPPLDAWQSFCNLVLSDGSARAEVQRALLPLLFRLDSDSSLAKSIQACCEDILNEAKNPKIEKLFSSLKKKIVKGDAIDAQKIAKEILAQKKSGVLQEILALRVQQTKERGEALQKALFEFQDLVQRYGVLSREVSEQMHAGQATEGHDEFLLIAKQDAVISAAFEELKRKLGDANSFAEKASSLYPFLEEPLREKEQSWPRLQGNAEDKDPLAVQSEKKGLELKNGVTLQSLVDRHGILSREVSEAVRQAGGQDASSIQRCIVRYVLREVDALLKNAKTFESNISKSYPFLAKIVSSQLKFRPYSYIKPVATHIIPLLNGHPKWSLYIDETGKDFDEKKGEGEEIEGRVVGLLFPENTKIRHLPCESHATHDSVEKKISILDELLSTECGIFGISAKDIRNRTKETWYDMVIRLIMWVLRLVPLAKDNKVRVNILIENRSDCSSEIDTTCLKKDLEVKLKEGKNRAQQVKIGDVAFVSKDTGQIAWVDYLANLWGSSENELKEYLKGSNLEGTCLFSNAGPLLDICEKAMTDKVTDIGGTGWQFLMERRDAGKKGSLPKLALDALKEHCKAHPAKWQLYVNAMAAYLDSKEYDLAVLERQAEWLHEMDAAENLEPRIRFFWHMARLAQLNHQGDVGSPELVRVKEGVVSLASEIGDLVPHAYVHAALRLAVVDSDAFDFAAAKRRLAPWNPDGGGRLLGSALWDGKILSSLGQAEAFQGRSEKALDLFEKAIAEFDKLRSIAPQESARQKRQTATYAAIAAMDAPGATRDKALPYIVRALGKTVMQTIRDLRGTGDRYSHYLLARFLSTMGSQEERRCYSESQNTWLAEEGCGLGHPWPLIQYFRWMITEGEELRKELAASIARCKGEKAGATVEMICLTLELATGAAAIEDPETQRRLEGLAKDLPAARSQIEILQQVNGGRDGLVERVLTFNYR